jgi:hypothetical protein
MDDSPQPEPDAQDKPADDDGQPSHTYVAVLWESLNNEEDTVMTWGPPQILEQKLRATVITPKGQNTIDVWLQSLGGSADEAYRYMLLFREYAARVRVVVGYHAKSAATLMLLGADEIFMGTTSDLGPLDVQIYVDEQDRYTSALDIARSVEHMAGMALDIALSGGGAVHGITGIPRRQVLPEILGFATRLVEPIVAKLDPSAIHRASNQLEVASEYGERLLRMRADPMTLEDARSLTYHLVNHYPSHGFIISRDEAVRIGLPVKPLTDYELVDAFEAMASKFEDDNTTCVAFKLPDPAQPGAEDVQAVDESDETVQGGN